MLLFGVAVMLQSCGGTKNLVVPHGVNTSGVVTAKDLRLQENQYDVLRTISESASVVCEFKNTEVRISSGDGDFLYKFKFDSKVGWILDSFQGVAVMGYFTNDYTPGDDMVPNPEEFARRVAMGKIISAVSDYNADGIIEPVTITSVSNLGKNKIEYRTTVRAKLIAIKTN